MISIEEFNTPPASYRQALVEILEDYNAGAGVVWSRQELALGLKEGDRLLGALIGNMVWGWLYVELIGVRKDVRGRGYGRRLLQHAERLAADRGCHGVWLNTKAFQAPRFYEALGYEAFATLDADPPRLGRVLFRKRLAR